MALASQWVASKVAHSVHYTVDKKTWIPVKRGMKMPKRSWIQTGKRGRLILRRGKEMIMYRQNTLAYLRSSQTNGRKTFIQQQFGSLLLDVETRKRKHVTVKTPLLAAVVKGTRFEVTVGEKGTTVAVRRGTVGVISNKSGKSVDINSGQSAAVSPTTSSQVSVRGQSGSLISRIVQAAKAAAGGNSFADGNANGVRNGNANGVGNGNANGVGNGNANGVGNGNAHGVSNGNANGVGNGNANGVGNGNANGVGNGNANGVGNGNANGVGNGNANGVGNGNANGVGNGK
jgi:hypothetical protein